jgi:hypothetical protein
MLGIITRAAADCHPQALRMRKVPMAAFAASVHKASCFQIGNQLSHFARHFSIRIVSRRTGGVNSIAGWRFRWGDGKPFLRGVGLRYIAADELSVNHFAGLDFSRKIKTLATVAMANHSTTSWPVCRVHFL